MKKRLLLVPLLSFALLFFSACVTDSKLAELEQFEPVPTLTPLEVVTIQLQALRNNDENDKGIEIAFRFASPRNKRFTGPVAKFATLFDSETFSPMLDPIDTEYMLPRITETVVMQPVRMTARDGRVLIYIFLLSKQDQGRYQDCWMVEGVQPYLQPGEQGDEPSIPELEDIEVEGGTFSA